MNSDTLVLNGRRVVDLYRDRQYYQRLVRIALPITLQNFIMSTLNMVANVMIGQLGETAVAAVGLAGQIFFLLNLALFGLASGAAIFTAQFWGNRDIPNIRRVVGISLVFSMAVGLFFWAIAIFLPETALSIYSKDEAVVALGSQYLRIIGWAYLFFAVSIVYALALRSTGEVKVPLMVSISALGVNILLSYGLIFGHFGLPKMGIQGAAVAALIARLLECAILLGVTYKRRLPPAVMIKDMVGIPLSFVTKVLRRVIPVTLNEVLWSLGITVYYIIYARIGTEAIAAMNIASTVDMMAMVLFIGIANACAILVGNLIGAGEEREAHRYAGRTIGLGIIGGVVMGVLIIAFSGPILSLYNVSAQVITNAEAILRVIALFFWVRISNLIIFIGVLRSGGDTRFAFILDAGTIWVIGVPLALIGGFVLHLPVQYVYMMAMVDEVTKAGFGVYRYFSRKWIHNLTLVVEAD